MTTRVDAADVRRIARIVWAIDDAFPDAPPPPFNRASPVPEVASAARESDGFTWRTIPWSTAHAVHDALPWLDTASFAYWVPGLLLDMLSDPFQADMGGYALVLALTSPRPSDLDHDVRTLERSHLDPATRTAAIARLTLRHERGRIKLFEDRWHHFTSAQRDAILDALKFLAEVHARDDAAEAVARWRR